MKKYLLDVSSHVWLVPLGLKCGRPEGAHSGRKVGTSQTQVAAGCGETHYDWQALQTKGIV